MYLKTKTQCRGDQQRLESLCFKILSVESRKEGMFIFSVVDVRVPYIQFGSVLMANVQTNFCV